ncbi:MAG: 2-oxo acid dehydrogenase subunit E2 [Chloroflexota bacterium]|nr:2-oxo acid dehydrogenase subunit E2 [Chloroflexota bacterium]
MRITMPQLGESVVEGTIGRWLKQEGEPVQQYEPLLEIITDKVNAEYPSPISGTLTRILVPEGETVPVNAAIAEVVASPAERAPDGQGTERRVPGTADSAESAVSAGSARRDESGRRYSPVVRRLAQEHHLDLTLIHGTGTGGRVTKQDVEAYLERRQGAPEVLGPQPVSLPGATTAGDSPSPLTTDELVRLTPMRRAIAEHTARSAFTAPHVTTVIEIDMTSIVRYRQQAKASFERREGVPLTYLPFVVQAVVESLRAHPRLNSSWSEQGIVIHREINIGVAVGLEDGLVVPVIRQANDKSLVGLARAIADVVSRARSGKLRPEDVEGGTFTVNNPGTFGTLMSTPIIVQPQAGILSMEAITKRPVVLGEDAIAIRSMMYASLSIDHRVLDGLQAARFLGDVKRRLEGFSPEGAGMPN